MLPLLLLPERKGSAMIRWFRRKRLEHHVKARDYKLAQKDKAVRVYNSCGLFGGYANRMAREAAHHEDRIQAIGRKLSGASDER